MRKNPISDGLRGANDFKRAANSNSAIRGLRLPVICIAIWIAVLYCSGRSVASMFYSRSDSTSAFAGIEEFTSTTLKTLWNSATAAAGLQGNETRRSVASSNSLQSTTAAASSVVKPVDKGAVATSSSSFATTSSSSDAATTASPMTAPGFGLSALTAPARPVINATTTNATWTWGSGTSDPWNDTANWAGGLQPQGANGSTVIHFAGSTRTTPNNDYSPFTLESQILFDSGAASFTLNGNAIQLNFKIENNSANTQFYNMSGLSFFPSVSGGFVELDPTIGDLIITTPASSVFLDNNAALLVFGSHILRMNAPIANGTNSVGSFQIQSSAATVIFANTNTYTGDTQINAGDLRFALNGSLPSSSFIRLGGTGPNSPAATLSLGTGGFGTGAYPMGALILATGEIVPIPEASTLLAAALAAAVLIFPYRQRLRMLVSRIK